MTSPNGANASRMSGIAGIVWVWMKIGGEAVVGIDGRSLSPASTVVCAVDAANCSTRAALASGSNLLPRTRIR